MTAAKLKKSAKIWQSVQKFKKVWKSVSKKLKKPKYAKSWVFEKVEKYTSVPKFEKSMRKCAKSWGSMTKCDNRWKKSAKSVWGLTFGIQYKCV